MTDSCAHAQEQNARSLATVLSVDRSAIVTRRTRSRVLHCEQSCGAVDGSVVALPAGVGGALVGVPGSLVGDGLVEQLGDPPSGLLRRLSGEVPAFLIPPDRPVPGPLVVLPGCWHGTVSL